MAPLATAGSHGRAPAGTGPDDLILLGSPALFDEVEAKVESVGPRILIDGYGPETPAKYRRQLELIYGLVTPPFVLDETPEHTQGATARTTS